MKRFAPKFPSNPRRRSRESFAARVGSAFLVGAAASVVPFSFDGGPLPGSQIISMPSPVVIEWAGGGGHMAADSLIVLPDYQSDNTYASSALLPNATVSAEVSSDSYYRAVGPNFGVLFEGDVPPSNVEAVVMEAVRIWDSVLAETAPVEISFRWVDMENPGILGYAGPAALYNGPGLGDGNKLYPSALANTLLGRDISSSSVEARVALNSQINWNISTHGSPSHAQLDLLTVVLHEIGHGLGFVGSARGQQLSTTPFMFDTQVMNGDQRLLDRPNPNSLLTSNALSIRISESMRAKLYAPSTWAQGSSLSHFDESTHPAGTPGSLMTPSLRRGEVGRKIDAYTTGVMARIGWPMQLAPVVPVLSASIVGDRIEVEIDPGLGQIGAAPDTYRVDWLASGQVVATQVVPASTAKVSLGGLEPGAAYSVRVTPVLGTATGRSATASVGFAESLLPSAPRAVSTTSGLTPTISWSRPALGAPSQYVIEISTERGPWVGVAETTARSIVVDVGEGVHQFRVAGINGHGKGPYGHSVPTGFSAGVVRPLPLDGQVARLYTAYFGRSPDQSGFTYWRERRAGGRTLQEISQEFASSPEFSNTYGLVDDIEFVELVYNNVLGRQSDSAGRYFWGDQLADGLSRGELMVGFSESDEFIAATNTRPPGSTLEAEMSRLYFAVFLRYPDESGLAYWVQQRSDGVALTDIGAEFASSSEFADRYGNLPDRSFVALVYNNVLGREPDSAGLNYWLDRLSNGLTRGTMMVDFSKSAEFVSKTGTIL